MGRSSWSPQAPRTGCEAVSDRDRTKQYHRTSISGHGLSAMAWLGRRPLDRMSPQDAMFISVEDECNPMHIGNVSGFEGPAPSYGDFVRTVAAPLSSLPRS